jgi:hypothetical protein
MKRFVSAAMFGLLVAHQATAEDTSINFADMPVGMSYTVEVIGKPNTLNRYEYIGVEDGFHIMEATHIPNGEEARLTLRRRFDAQGRRVRDDLVSGVYTSYEPFDCNYGLGACTHVREYPNSKDPAVAEMFKKKTSYTVTLEDDKLVVVTDTGFETVYTLGPFNLRVGAQSTSSSGRLRGYTLVEVTKS